MANIQIKPISTIVSKWQTRAGGAGQDYVNGINNPKRPQAQTAAAAAPQWAAGVSAAVTNGTFARNVLAAAQKYITNATGKGAARYPSGIQAGVNDFQNGITPVINLLSNLQLPPRATKGDPSNISRVSAVDQALHQWKISQAT
jgi:hypothetical protein